MDDGKDNIITKEDLADIWNLYKEARFLIIAPKDKQFIEVAISLIGAYPRENDSWQKLTDELKLTGRTGKDLLCTSLFSTGKSDGPDMKKLFPNTENPEI